MIDLERPDINRAPPKMEAVSKVAKATLQAPWLRISTNDNLCSSVFIRGSFDADWSDGIFRNSRYFIFSIYSEGGKRYYASSEKVVVTLNEVSHQLGKFRRYTGTPEKCIAKIAKWISENSI